MPRSTPPAPIKTILWDNDGVLVDTEHLYFKATRHILETIGVELTKAEYIELFLVQNRGAWDRARDQGLDDEAVERLRLQRNAYYAELLARQNAAIDGAAGVLAQLHGRFAMGVVTSSRRHHFEVIHAQTGFLPYFDFVLTCDDVTRTKPDPEPYLKALERSGSVPSDCIVIEDSARGLHAAKAAGLSCWVIPTGLTLNGDFSKADAVLRHIREVPALLGLEQAPVK